MLINILTPTNITENMVKFTLRKELNFWADYICPDQPAYLCQLSDTALLQKKYLKDVYFDL